MFAIIRRFNLEPEDIVYSSSILPGELTTLFSVFAALAGQALPRLSNFDEGYASYVEVRDAQRFLFDAELQYVAVQGDVYASLIGTYKAMGGGWVIEAQRDADETDFPREQTDSESPLVIPKPTRPTGIETDPGYR